MSQVLLIKQLCVQNANAVAGLTYGFPAISHFLGFSHKLSRAIKTQFNCAFSGVAIICHQHQVHAKQPKGRGDYVFALSRNPLTAKGETAPIIEEGRMDLQLSLLLQIEGLNQADEQRAAALVQYLSAKLPAMRLAGGQITNKPQVSYCHSHNAQSATKLLRALMPGFALVDRHAYLQQHYQTCRQQQASCTLFDAWLDFAALKRRAVAAHSPPEATPPSAAPLKTEWHYQSKPEAGYLVPLMVGYRAISELYAPGKVAKVRDTQVPAVFAEAAYSVGEWLSPHRAIHNMADLFWHYRHQAPWYIASSAQQALAQHATNSPQTQTPDPY